MKKHLLLLFTFCTIALATSFFIKKAVFTTTSTTDFSVVEQQHQHEEEFEYEGGKAAFVGDRYRQEYEKTKNPAGKVPRHKLKDAFKLAKQTKLQKSSFSITWEERGPNNVGGRTRAVLFDANDQTHKTVFAAGASGGLWRSNDITAADPGWILIDDFLTVLNITCIAQNPNNPDEIVIGSGEGYNEYEESAGMGIFISTDGGDSFSQLASTDNTDFNYVQDVLYDGNGNIFAATYTGVFRSTDSGSSWTGVLTTDKGSDLEIGADGSLYATLGFSFGSTGKVFKSAFATHGANVGEIGNWTDITPAGSHKRMELATAPSDADVLYVLWEASTGFSEIGYFGVSTDGGATWIDKTANVDINGMGRQIIYDLIIEVNPSDPTLAYAGGVEFFILTGSGDTWTKEPNMHPDHHNVVFMPGSSTNAVVANDGGLYYSTDMTAAMPTFTDKDLGYNVTQYYGGDIHPGTANDLILGGTQDNGSHRLTQSGIGAATVVSGGDGGFSHVDQDEPNFMWTSFVRNRYFRSTDGGNTWSGLLNLSISGQFINPTDYDDAANIMYCGAGNGELLRWSNPQTGEDFDLLTIPTNAGLPQNITTIKLSPNVPNRVYFGTNAGNVYYMDNANTGAGTPAVHIFDGVFSTISSIDIEKGNEEHALITISNYGVNSVHESTSVVSGGLGSFTSVEGNLPDMPIRWGVFNPLDANQVILATDVGVWTTDNLDGGATVWGASGSPNVRTEMLKFRESDNYLVAYTYGRGIFGSFDFAKVAVNFDNTATTIAEQPNGTPTGVCSETYQEVAIPVSLSRPTEANLSVQISIDPNTTATSNRDFQLMTPDLVFTPNGASTQQVIVRITDDSDIEPTELISLTLNVAQGTGINGDVIKTEITIEDDEVAAFAGTTNITTTPLTPTDHTTFFFGQRKNLRNQTIYTAAELTASGAVAGNITSIAFDVSNNFATGPFNGYNIKMQHTSLSSFPSTDFIAGGTVVHSSTLTTQLGWNIVTFDTPFVWDGVSNIIIETCFANDPAVGAVFVRTTETTNNQFLFNRSNFGTGCSLSAVNDDENRPVFRFTVDNPIALADELNDTDNAYASVGHSTIFYDSEGELLAEVKQLSGNDIGCINITLDGIGDGQVSPDFLDGDRYTERTFLIEADNDADYQVTLYFSADDLAVWGANAQNLNMLKSELAIANATRFNSEILTNDNLTVVQDNDATVIGYQANFNSFSGFALTDATSIMTCGGSNDTESPVIGTPANATTNVNTATGVCTAQVNVQFPSLSDNVDLVTCPPSFTYTLSGATNQSASNINSYTGDASQILTFNVGTTTITFNATDASGNNATPKTATVNVVDNELPTFTCPTNEELSLNNNCEITIPNFVSVITDAADNCTTPTITQSLMAGETLGLTDGMTSQVMISVDDGNGNVATCSVNITAQDNNAPQVITNDHTITLNSDGTYTLTTNDLTMLTMGTTDNCDELAALTITATPNAFGCEDLNAQTIQLTANDSQGNVSTAQSATLTVQAPQSQMMIEATSTTVEEQASTTTIELVVRRTNSACAATVDFMTVAGVAMEGSDYTGQSGTLQFAAGEESQSIIVEILSDMEVEEDETFSVQLSNPTNNNSFVTDEIEITITDFVAPLAVEWLNFTAQVSEKRYVELDWKVANEGTTSHFTVERSANGTDFIAIQKVTATKALRYTFTDDKPLMGTSYYRLREVATNGQFSFSVMRQILLETPDAVQVFPNPTTGMLKVQAAEVIKSITVFDRLGKVVYTVPQTTDRYELDLTQQQAGLYFIQIETASGKRVQRIIKE